MREGRRGAAGDFPTGQAYLRKIQALQGSYRGTEDDVGYAGPQDRPGAHGTGLGGSVETEPSPPYVEIGPGEVQGRVDLTVQNGILPGVVQTLGQDLVGFFIGYYALNGASRLPFAISISRRMWT